MIGRIIFGIGLWLIYVAMFFVLMAGIGAKP